MFSRFLGFFSGIFAVLRYHPQRIPLVFEAAFTLLWARCLTWFVPFHRYRARLAATELSGRAIEPIRLTEVAWVVNRLSKFTPKILNCLPQALTVQTMLRRRGTEGTMCFGIKASSEGAIKAHAWVEWEGRVLIGQLPDLENYARLPTWPG